MYIHIYIYYFLCVLRYMLVFQKRLKTRLGIQVKVKCSVATSRETGKLVLQLMYYLNLLFQNTWSFINWYFDTISLIVCIKKATKCVMGFPLQNDLNGALDVGVFQIYFLLNFYEYLNLTFKLIAHNIIKPLGKSYILWN